MKSFHSIFAPLIFIAALPAVVHGQQVFYKATDLTAENLFTENIEGPNTDKNGNLFVVNFQSNGTVGKVHKTGEVELFVTLPVGSTGNSIMFDDQDNFLLADYTGHNILKIVKATRAISVYAHSDQFNQPNDLCINRKGQLFASDPNWKEGIGKLWRIDKGRDPVLLSDQMGTTNGIELSPDETLLYVNESVQRKIWAFAVSPGGDLSNKRLFYEFKDFGLDGMKCDQNGNLYVTRYGKGTIAIVSPKGEQIREVVLTGKKPSNLTFGGPNGNICYVTLQDRRCVEMFFTEIPGKRH